MSSGRSPGRSEEDGAHLADGSRTQQGADSTPTFFAHLFSPTDLSLAPSGEGS